jgi:hypothetical protein
MKCVICGKEIEKSCYMNAVLCSNIECFNANFWNECIDDKAIIINGECYHDGGKKPKGDGRFLGYGGALVKIKMNNGEIIETNNLRYNGEIPKDRNIQDNASFITD